MNGNKKYILRSFQPLMSIIVSSGNEAISQLRLGRVIN